MTGQQPPPRPLLGKEGVRIRGRNIEMANFVNSAGVLVCGSGTDPTKRMPVLPGGPGFQARFSPEGP